MKNHHDPVHSSCPEYAELSRRGFLARSGILSAAGLTSTAWLPRVVLARGSSGVPRDVLVHVFLRGGTDGLSVVVPHGDPFLYSARPNLAVPPPGQTNGAIDLDGFFGFNPNAAPLMSAFNNGHLAVVHAAGSTDPTRSHFDAMKAMEGGVPNQSLVNVSTGWLGRHLADTPPVGGGLLRGLALEQTMPLHLIGSEGTLPISDPDNFDFPGRDATKVQRRLAIETMYQGAEEPLAGAAISTLATIDLLATIDFAGYQTSGGKAYPQSAFGQQLKASAALIKAGIDIEAIGIDYGGWDHHENQGPIGGVMAILLGDLTNSLEAFYLDMLAGGQLDSLVILLMSEFGRRLAENVSMGTDHGHGNMMMAIGGHIAGGQVFANWPGLDPASLDDGDLSITIDYRDIVSEILANRLANGNLANVFPNHTPTFYGITV